MTIPLSCLPPGLLRLVDNRIMAGAESTWVPTQPVTVCVMHPKHFKDENRALVEELIRIVNAARAAEKGMGQSET